MQEAGVRVQPFRPRVDLKVAARWRRCYSTRTTPLAAMTSFLANVDLVEAPGSFECYLRRGLSSIKHSPEHTALQTPSL